MQRPLAVTLSMVIAGAVLATDEEPWAFEKPIMSPSHSFTITQKCGEDWSTTVHFEHTHAPDIKLSDTYPWPALFYVAPDDHWMLQVQKSGSGENISFLFRVDPEGRLWRMEPSLMEVVWLFLGRTESLHESDLYHTGIDFRSWDLQANLVRFTFHGTYSNRQGGVDIPLTYDLQKHVVVRDPKA